MQEFAFEIQRKSDLEKKNNNDEVKDESKGNEKNVKANPPPPKDYPVPFEFNTSTLGTRMPFSQCFQGKPLAPSSYAVC